MNQPSGYLQSVVNPLRCSDWKVRIDMKRLNSIETEKIQLEVIECDCGFHIGLDTTYLLQVGDFIIKCPACGTNIYTKEVLPE